MDISKAALEELLFMLEIKKLKIVMRQNFQELWTEEQIYDKIYQLYSKEDKALLIKRDEKEKLYQWIKERSRYSLLEVLIKMLLEKLLHPQLLEGVFFNVVDPFILNNFNLLIQILLETANTYIPINNYRVVPKTPLTKQNLHVLLSDILKEIDPSLEWLSLYNQMNDTNRVIYVDELSEEEKERIGKELLSRGNVCLVKEDGPYILFHPKGTIDDAPSLLHEIIHYISYCKGHPSRVLSEFPSLFFENYAFQFLERKGYSKDEIQFLKKERLENIISLSPYVFIICHYGLMFLNHHEINEMLDIEAERNGLLALPKHMETLIQGYSFPDYDFKTSANARCDNCIAQLILHDQRFFQSYPYIIGNFLASEITKTNLDVLSQMKHITEDLDSIDPADIFKLVGCKLEDTTEKERTNR